MTGFDVTKDPAYQKRLAALQEDARRLARPREECLQALGEQWAITRAKYGLAVTPPRKRSTAS